MKIAYTQSAAGKVTLPYRPGFPHCGPENKKQGGTVTMHYRIHLEFPEGALDTKGFLLDNLTFGDFFEACQFRFRSGLEHSCENFARYCCEQFCLMSTCHTARVEISAIDGVWVGYHMASDRYCPDKSVEFKAKLRAKLAEEQTENYMAHREWEPDGSAVQVTRGNPPDTNMFGRKGDSHA